MIDNEDPSQHNVTDTLKNPGEPKAFSVHFHKPEVRRQRSEV